MAVSKISRTVRFYRLTATGGDGTPFALGNLNFGGMLKEYRKRPISKRRHAIGGSEYLFDPRDTGSRHLAVHKLRSPSDFMARVATDGQVTEIMAVDETGSFADSAAVSFLTYGNIFGIVGGNQSAPRAGRIADWLTEIKPFGNSLTFSANPVLAQPMLESLEAATGARRVSVAIRGSDLTASEDESLLGERMRYLLDDLEDAKLTLTITTGHHTPTVTLREKLMNLTRDLAENLSGNARAQAALVHEVPAASGKNRTKLVTEIVDLVEYHIAQEFEISLSEAGIRIDLTLQQMDVIAGTERASLRRALAEEVNSETTKEKGP